MRARVFGAVAVVFLAPVAASAALPAAPVTVEGDAICPGPVLVAARVATLLPGDAPVSSPPVARVDRAGRDVRVRLADPGGAIVAERILPADGDCGELADMVAVTITTWMTELRPEWLPAPRLPPVAIMVSPPAPTARLTGEGGVGAGVSVGEGGVAEAASLLLSLHGRSSGLGAMTRATGTTGRDVSVGAHTATWRRWEIAVGPSYQSPPIGALRLTGSLGFAAGWLSASGQDFPTNRTASRFSPGAAALIRVARARGLWSPWFALGVSVAFFEQSLTVGGSADRRALRAVTLDALVGISIGRYPSPK
ncbi:MAG TPA: hypothetical protein VGY48_35160 [Vicinamibacterales bacterium]|nr:hypothetical protein [Vicinamibacterales bacterium]